MDNGLRSRFRQRIEAIEPTDADTRERLNQAYSDLVQALRQLFQAACFDAPAASQHEAGSTARA
jgi:hypothetical protein